MSACPCYYCKGGTFDEQEVWEGEKKCKVCQHTLWHSRCHAGCDDGYFDGYEEDPLWYHPGELYACPECRGHGTLTFCPLCEHEERKKVEAADRPS